MNIQAPTVRIDHAIIHSLPRGKWSDGREDEVVYSTSPTALSVRSLSFFSEQLQPAIVDGRRIVAKANTTSPLPETVTALLSDTRDLAGQSAKLAKHMFDVQAGQSPSAIFFLAVGAVRGEPCVIVMKAEHQTGIQIRKEPSKSGTLLIADFLEDLIVGNKTEVYKIAVMTSSPSGVAGLMLDKQNGVAYADYFLDDFLGCDLAVRNELLVKEFVDAAMKFANRAELPPEKRDRYSRALAAELASADPVLTPTQWSTKHLDPEDRDTFADYLPPHVSGGPFPKDLTMVRNLVGGVRYSTDTGVSISFDPAAIAEGIVTFRTNDLGEDEIVIRGSINANRLQRSAKR